MNRLKPPIYRIFAIITGVMALIAFSPMPPVLAHHAASCDDVYTPLSSLVINGVNNNQWAYVTAMNETSVPWEMLAAIHYRETNFSHSNPSNGQGIFQFVNSEGGPYPPGPVSNEEFYRQLKFMANKLQNDYVWRGSVPRERRPLRHDETNIALVKDTLFSYNGRASVYADQAVHFGYDRTTQPFEGSPYVMNRFDCPRARMGIITQDLGSMDGIDTRYGTFTIFARLRGQWFGPEFCYFDFPKPVISDVQLRKTAPNIDSGELILYSGTRTNCIESHSWGDNFATWSRNRSSNQPALIPNDCALRFADLSGDGRDEPVLICLRNTGSNMVEFHVWNYDMKTWVVHAVSNLPSIDPTKITIEFADTDGTGRDEPIAIGYNDTTSGMVEFHFWDLGLQTWRKHVITNLPTVNPANMNLHFADVDGDTRDEAIGVGVNNTASGRIEFHIWNTDFLTWRAHIISNQPVVNMNDFGILFGNFAGSGPDRGVLVGKQNTASGRIEFHIWNTGLDSWSSHNASNQPTFQ